MMSDVDNFLLGANDEIDSLFGTETMVCSGQTFSVVVNEIRENKEGALGGLEPDIQAVVTAQPGDVSNPKSMLQKRCTLGGVAYRVYEVSIGTVAIQFILSSVDDSR
jgi:hypothetical protein